MSIVTGKNIAVLQGGPGSERKVSLKTAEGVIEALKKLGAIVSVVDVTGYDFSVPDPVFIAMNMIHGTFGEDGQVQEILESKGVRYTGAGVGTSRVAFDKALSKDAFLKAGVPTPLSQHFNLDGSDTLQLGLPVVVKPLCEGSSVGVHICRDQIEFEMAILDAKKFGATTLIEDYIEGKELTVGILGEQVLPVIEIIPVDGFYSLENKYPWLTGSGKSNYECPANLDAATTKCVQDAALAAYKAIGVEVYGRVDLMLRASDNQPFVLELNTIPGMTPTSLLPKAASAVGISYDQLCERIVELSLEARG